MATPPSPTQSPKTNYIAYSTLLGPRIGHLDLTSNTITPLVYTSSTPLTTLYEVIQASSLNIQPSTQPAIPLSSAHLLPPISGRDVLAVGKNYLAHAREFHASGYDATDLTAVPTHPVIFTKRATSIIASGEPILLHRDFTDSVDYEGEIGLIVGKPGFQITEEDAMDHVWGYTIVNDVSARDRQRDHKQFFLEKSPDTFCPVGPIAVPKEDLPGNLHLRTWVNGEKRQDAWLDMMIFDPRVLVRTISAAQTLQVGDVIATGTPFGVGFGFEPARFLKAGDEVRIAVSGLGELVNCVADAEVENPTLAKVRAVSHVPVHNQRVPLSELSYVEGKGLFVQLAGVEDSKPVLFIHGLGGSSSYFSALTSSLASSRTLVLPDLEGHGLSPTSAISVLSIESFAADTAAICKHSGVTGKFDVVAHSMGCLIALKFAIENPDLVSRLVLLGPPPSPLGDANCKEYLARADSVRARGMIAVADQISSATISEHSKKHNPLSSTAAKMSLLGQDPEGYSKACTALARSVDEKLRVEKISVPTLILTGSHDAASTPAVCEQYAAEMKGAEVKVLDNVGHWHLFEDAAGTVRAVLKFLEGG